MTHKESSLKQNPPSPKIGFTYANATSPGTLCNTYFYEQTPLPYVESRILHQCSCPGNSEILRTATVNLNIHSMLSNSRNVVQPDFGFGF